MNTSLQPPRMQLTHELYTLADATLARRYFEAVEAGRARYPVHRELRFAAALELEVLFDAIALSGHWQAMRPDASRLILDGEHVFITAEGSRKQDYCSAWFEIWAASPAEAENARATLLAIVGEARLTAPMFAIDWHFLSGRGELQSVKIEERADDVLVDQAYPELAGGVAAYIERFLAADETVLVLQGPPGTGKTRLIRAILGAMTHRNGRDARALYTGDKKALESDEIFVRFITGWEDAFVIEDADHVLKPRADGNEHLHRFLTIADGVVRSQGRKIIFSTNLPNVGDLDDALVRPGRCFGLANIRELTRAEAESLLAVLAPNVPAREQALGQLVAGGRQQFAVAEVYAALRERKREPVAARKRMCLTA